jgi:hypothetical protein
MRKKLVVVSGTFYPLTMMHYFIFALKRRPDVELITVGPYTGTWIPWKGGMHLPQQYATPPTYPLAPELINPPSNTSPMVVDAMIKAQYRRVPDLWLQIDAGFYFNARPNAKHVALVATDPHCLLYNAQRRIVDKFFNMQKAYMQDGDILLPYAYDPFIHKYKPLEKFYEGCLIGALYPERQQLVKALQDAGYNIYTKVGEVFEVYAERYNHSKVALNVSSMLDVNARTFEAMGMRRPLLTNRLPALSEHFKEGVHYMGFDTVSEAVHQFRYMMDREHKDEMDAMVENAYAEVSTKHTYDIRIEQIFKEVGL